MGHLNLTNSISLPNATSCHLSRTLIFTLALFTDTMSHVNLSPTVISLELPCLTNWHLLRTLISTLALFTDTISHPNLTNSVSHLNLSRTAISHELPSSRTVISHVLSSLTNCHLSRTAISFERSTLTNWNLSHYFDTSHELNGTSHQLNERKIGHFLATSCHTLTNYSRTRTRQKYTGTSARNPKPQTVNPTMSMCGR